MHGGGTGQFAAIPQNIGYLSKNLKKPIADYLITGSWSDKAAKEGEKFINVNKVNIFIIKITIFLNKYV